MAGPSDGAGDWDGAGGQKIKPSVTFSPTSTATQIADLLDNNDNTTRRLIQGLAAGGLIEKIGDSYQLVHSVSRLN